MQPISDIIKSIADKIQALIDKLRNLKLPDWLDPGSPTPFELGLRGIADAMADLNRTHLPAFSMQLAMAGIPRGGAAVAGNTFNMSVFTNSPTEPILSDFATMQSWWRG
jgi:hypothetical protein